MERALCLKREYKVLCSLCVCALLRLEYVCVNAHKVFDSMAISPLISAVEHSSRAQMEGFKCASGAPGIAAVSLRGSSKAFTAD